MVSTIPATIVPLRCNILSPFLCILNRSLTESFCQLRSRRLSLKSLNLRSLNFSQPIKQETHYLVTIKTGQRTGGMMQQSTFLHAANLGSILHSSPSSPLGYQKGSLNPEQGMSPEHFQVWSKINRPKNGANGKMTEKAAQVPTDSSLHFSRQIPYFLLRVRLNYPCMVALLPSSGEFGWLHVVFSAVALESRSCEFVNHSSLSVTRSNDSHNVVPKLIHTDVYTNGKTFLQKKLQYGQSFIKLPTTWWLRYLAFFVHIYCQKVVVTFPWMTLSGFLLSTANLAGNNFYQ